MRFTFGVIVSVAWLLSACGGGGGSGSAGENPQAGTESLVPAGNPVIYVTSTLQAGGTADEVITTITQYVPASGESVLIDRNSSFSFARSSTGLFTFDDRLILLRNSGTSGFSGGTWTRIDTDAQVDKSSDLELQPATLVLNTAQGSATSSCVAASDSTLYWRDAGAALRSAPMTVSGAAVETELFASGDPNVCFRQVFTIDGLNRVIGGMDYADGTFYDVDFDDTSGQMSFYSRDPLTAAPTLINTLTPLDHASYNPGYSISFDGGQAYFARVEASNGQLEIWSYDFVNQPLLLLTMTINNLASISGLDVDDGYFVMRLLEQGATAFNSTNILLFDSNTMTTQTLDLLVINPATPGLVPPTFDNVRILYRQP